MRRLFMSIEAALVLFGITEIALANEINLFGPNTYTRTAGSPNVYTDSFTSTFTDATLIVNNNDTTSALIYVNERQILGPNDFKKKAGLLKVPLFNLGSKNLISVEIRSKPGSSITIQVIKSLLTPDQVLSELVNNLKKKDIQSALTKFVPSLKNQEALNTLDQAAIDKLTDSLQNAKLIEATSNYRVYTTTFLDEHGTHNPRFMMYLNQLGEWKINSW